jgi:hypothetical protein
LQTGEIGTENMIRYRCCMHCFEIATGCYSSQVDVNWTVGFHWF